MHRRSRASGTDGGDEAAPRDPYGLALRWLGQRELSALQVRQRLARRGVAAEHIDPVVDRLVADGALNESRMALAAARLETIIKGRGPGRTRQKLRALGLPPEVADAAMATAMADVDVDTLLERALERRLRRLPSGPPDRA